MFTIKMSTTEIMGASRMINKFHQRRLSFVPAGGGETGEELCVCSRDVVTREEVVAPPEK